MFEFLAAVAGKDRFLCLPSGESTSGPKYKYLNDKMSLEQACE